MKHVPRPNAAAVLVAGVPAAVADARAAADVPVEVAALLAAADATTIRVMRANPGKKATTGVDSPGTGDGIGTALVPFQQ